LPKTPKRIWNSEIWQKFHLKPNVLKDCINIWTKLFYYSENERQFCSRLRGKEAEILSHMMRLNMEWINKRIDRITFDVGSKYVKGTSRTRRRKKIFILRGNSHAIGLIIFNGIARVGWEKYRTHRQPIVWKNVLPLTFNNFQGKSTTWHSDRRKTLSTTGFFITTAAFFWEKKTWRPRKRCKTCDSHSMTFISWKLSFRRFVSIFIWSFVNLFGRS